MANEPLAGTRMVEVTERKTKMDWAFFVEKNASCYEDAEKITLVMDNLNIHAPGSLYEAFAPKKAKALWDRFEFVFTPKHGSWLDMAEIELNVLIAEIEVMRNELKARESARNGIKAGSTGSSLIFAGKIIFLIFVCYIDQVVFNTLLSV